MRGEADWGFRKVEDRAQVAAAGFWDAAFYWDVETDFVLAKGGG